MRFPPLPGDILYHGTSSKESFEDDGETPDGPAWFSDGRAVAERFSTWHPGPNPRVIAYRVIDEPNLKIITYDGDMIDLVGEDRFYDGLEVEDLIDAVQDAGYDGWFMPENYPEGADIMILYPSDFLEVIRRENPSDPTEAAEVMQVITPMLVRKEVEFAAHKQSVEIVETDYEDGLFSSTEHAEEFIRDVASLFSAMQQKPVLTLYRSIKIDSLDDLDLDYLGESWSWLKESALEFGSHAGANYLLVANVPRESIDWHESVRRFLENSSLSAIGEEELVVLDESAIDLLACTKIRSTCRRNYLSRNLFKRKF